MQKFIYVRPDFLTDSNIELWFTDGSNVNDHFNAIIYELVTVCPSVSGLPDVLVGIVRFGPAQTKKFDL